MPSFYRWIVGQALNKKFHFWEACADFLGSPLAFATLICPLFFSTDAHTHLYAIGMAAVVMAIHIVPMFLLLQVIFNHRLLRRRLL
jgi:hypothetical protein